MKYKILVVDDDVQTFRNVKTVFSEKKKDTAVITSDHADIAIEMAWKEKPDVIIINRELPGMSGMEVLGILKKNKLTRSTPMIILDEQFNGPKAEVEALEAGADDYIRKPFNSKVFYARVKAALHRSKIWAEAGPESEDILKKYSGKIEQQIKTVKPISSEEYSRAYIKFKKEMAPQLSRYERLCKSIGSIINLIFFIGLFFYDEFLFYVPD